MTARARLLLLLALTAAIHLPALGGDYVYDDPLRIAQNAALQRSDLLALLAQPAFGPQQAYWRPLSELALWLGHAVGGAPGIHLLALLAHLLATACALRIADALVGDSRCAWVAALAFALHPVQVEGIAWCSALNDPLWLAFGLRTLDAALRGRTVAAAAACLGALLAKENALVLLPLAVVAAGIRNPGRARPMACALTAAVGAWWLARCAVFGSLDGGLGRAPVDPSVAAQMPLASVALLGRQLGLLLWPWPLSPFRALTSPDGTHLIGLGPALGWLGAWLAGCAFALRRRDPVRILCLLLIAAEPLLAALRADRLGAYPVSDRYVGLAAFGAALFAATCLPARWRTTLLAACALVGAVATWRQTPTWSDADALLAHGLHAAPHEPALQVMAGNLALGRRDFATARRSYQQALTLLPAAGAGMAHRASVDAHIGLGKCSLDDATHDTAAAVTAFEQALRADDRNAQAWIGLGVAHGMAGRGAEAERALRRAVELAPDNSQAHFNLAYLYAQQGRRELAQRSAREALRCDPGNDDARRLLEGR